MPANAIRGGLGGMNYVGGVRYIPIASERCPRPSVGGQKLESQVVCTDARACLTMDQCSRRGPKTRFLVCLICLIRICLIPIRKRKSPPALLAFAVLLHTQKVRRSSPLSPSSPLTGRHRPTSPTALSRGKAAALYPDRPEDFGPRRVIC